MLNRKWSQIAIILIIASLFIIGATQRFDTIIAKKIITTSSSGVTLNGGGTLNLASGGLTMASGNLTLTAGDATLTAGDLAITAGDLAIGDGTPDVTQDGEDAYVEGTLEVDGLATLDGGSDYNGATVVLDADGDTTRSVTVDDIITVTLGAAAGRLDLLTGNLRVGNGTPTVTQDGEDVYVEGTFETDGLVSFSGVISQPIGVENFGNGKSILSQVITFTAAAGGSGTLATITDGEIWFVHSVFIRTTTDFDATGDDATFTIGDGNVAAGFIDAADANLQAAFTEDTGYAAGWYGIENGSGGAYTLDDGGPFVYAPSGADETIDWLLDESSGETISAGQLTAYIVYTRIQ